MAFCLFHSLSMLWASDFLSLINLWQNTRIALLLYIRQVIYIYKLYIMKWKCLRLATCCTILTVSKIHRKLHWHESNKLGYDMKFFVCRLHDENAHWIAVYHVREAAVMCKNKTSSVCTSAPSIYAATLQQDKERSWHYGTLPLLALMCLEKNHKKIKGGGRECWRGCGSEKEAN